MSSLSLPALTALCRGLLPGGLAVLLQSTLLLLLGLCAGRLLSRRGPAYQSAVYRAALVGVLLAALSPLAPVRPAWPVSPLPLSTLPPVPVAPPPAAVDGGQPASAAVPRPIGAKQAPGTPLSRDVTHTSPAPERSRPAELARWLPLAAIALWAGGAVLLLGWLCLGLARVVQLRRRSDPVTVGPVFQLLRSLGETRAARPPELRASRLIDGPLLLGGRRPAMLLPATDLEQLDPTALRAILIHELAHLERRDDLWNLASRLLRALLWPQPLLWALCRRIEQASEEACDAAVLSHGIEPKSYASCLLTLAERFLPHPAERALGLGVVAIRTSVGRRVQRILAPSPRAPLSLSRRTRAGIALGAAPAVLLTVFLIAPPPRSGVPVGASAPNGTATEDPAHPIVSVEAARHQLSFPLFVPRSLPVGASLLGVRVFVPEIANLSEVLHYVHSHRWIESGFGLMILPSELIRPGSRGWVVNAMPGSPAAQAGIGPKARPLLALNGRPVGSGPDLPRALSSYAPLRVTFRGRDGQPRTVTLRKRTYISGPGMPEVLHTREAALLMTYQGRSWEILQKPTGTGPRAPRYARHLRVGRREVSVHGTREVYSAFWQEAGVNLDLNNRAGMSEAQVTDVIRSMHPEPPIASPPARAAPRAATAEATIIGRVVDAQGRPVPGLRVMAQAQRGVRGARLWAEDTSRADGSYRLGGLQTAPYNVILEDPSQQRVAPAAEGIAAEVGRTVRAPDLVITPGAIVEGTVTDARTGQPLVGAEVVSVGPALPASSATTLAARADRNGRYRLRVAPGLNRICVDVAMGYSARDRFSPAGNPPGVPVQVASGETKEVPLSADRPVYPAPKTRRRGPIPMGYGG
jgi:beta-lactamase regulating signal transducer with metallopeptidase domain